MKGYVEWESSELYDCANLYDQQEDAMAAQARNMWIATLRHWLDAESTWWQRLMMGLPKNATDGQLCQVTQGSSVMACVVLDMLDLHWHHKDFIGKEWMAVTLHMPKGRRVWVGAEASRKFLTARYNETLLVAAGRGEGRDGYDQHV